MREKKMQLSVEAIVKERVSLFLQEAIRYGRLIGSSGLLFATVVLTFVAIIYYQDFIDWLPSFVPVDILLAFLLAVYTIKTNQRTFLKEADILFLTPVEKRMERFFSITKRYNFIIQSVVLSILLLILAPLYLQKVAETSLQILFYFIVPILLKGWNLQSHWQVIKSAENRFIFLHKVCRFFFSFLLLYWVYSGGSLFVFEGYAVGGVLFATMFICFFLVDRKVSLEQTYSWYKLLEMELRLQRRFYQFVHAFVDVPQLQQQIKPRKWANLLIQGVPFRKSSSYPYLYLRTFLRAGEYFGIFIRLSLIGGLLVYTLPNLYVQGIVFLTFIFLLSTQMKGLATHHKRVIWSEIFPISKAEEQKAFSVVCFLILASQTSIMLFFLLFSIDSWLFFLSFMLAGLLVSYLLAYKYKMGRGRKKSSS